MPGGGGGLLPTLPHSPLRPPPTSPPVPPPAPGPPPAPAAMAQRLNMRAALYGRPAVGRAAPPQACRHPPAPAPSPCLTLTTFAGLRRPAALHAAGAPSTSGRALQAAAARRGPRRAGPRSRVTRMMFERFTEKAIKVVMLAQEEARRLGHNFVGTEQILLGLIGESTGIAAKVLKSMDVNLKDARVEVEKVIGRGSGFVAVEIPFTPRAKRVLELSLEEARQLGTAIAGASSFVSREPACVRDFPSPMHAC